MNNNFFNTSDDNWFIKKKPIYKPIFPIASVNEPVVTNLPYLKTESEPKITNYSDKGGEKKSSGTGVIGKDFFGATMPPEIAKVIRENAPNKNSSFIQERFDKYPDMWYYKSQNNSSEPKKTEKLADTQALAPKVADSAQNVGKKVVPKKEDRKNRLTGREDFFADLDLKNLPTEEEMDFADGAFGSLPGFLEDNDVLRNIVRYIKNGGNNQNKYGLDGAKIITSAEKKSFEDVESKRQSARRKYEEKYRAEVAETEETKVAENENKRQATRNLYEEERYLSGLSAAEKAEYYFKKYFSEEERKDIENGESLMTYVINLDGRDQEKILNAFQDAYNELPKDKQEEYAFFAEGALYGLAREDKKRIFEKLKSTGYLEPDHLVELGLFAEKDKNNAIATSFLAEINGSYKAKQFGTSFEELEFRLDQERIGQAYSVVADNLFKISDAAVNGPSKSYSSSDGDILYSDNVNVKPSKIQTSAQTENTVSVQKLDGAEAKSIQVKINQINGEKSEKLFEKVINFWKGSYAKHTKIKSPSGYMSIPDFLRKDENGEYYIFEVKSSKTARYTKNQLQVFAEIIESGGYIVGKKKQAYFGTEFFKPKAIYKVVQDPNGGLPQYYKFGQ